MTVLIFILFRSSSNISTYSHADSNRNQAERLRSEAVRLMRETDEKTAIGQRDAGRRLGERITDVTFWRNELNTELEKLVAESAQLAEVKRNVQKALQVRDAIRPKNKIVNNFSFHYTGY